MGLDMFAFSAPVSEMADQSAQVDCQPNQDGAAMFEFHYWRNHSMLQVYMGALYHRKGGTEEVFSLNANVRLTLDDLNRLEQDLKARVKTDPEYAGSGRVFDDMQFVNDARETIAAGNVVLFTSWW